LPELPLDVFYAFWLPLSRALEPGVAWAILLGASALAAGVPWWTRPPAAARLPASHVDPHLCTGCEQCALDCPFDAIEMRAVEGGRAPLAAHIDPTLCVSCGICAGSCAPMAVGPPGRTGRDQLAAARAFLAERELGPRDVVVIGCESAAGGADAPLLPTSCAGNLHSSVVELLVRAGAGGVLVVTCPARDCRGREGPHWLGERLFHEREAELQERVDRRRVRVVAVAPAERGQLREELARFRVEVAALDEARPERDLQLDAECQPPAVSEAGA
jgi:ferredoxin/coenzyme F420-reducing hydrogenase delta subunit